MNEKNLQNPAKCPVKWRNLPVTTITIPERFVSRVILLSRQWDKRIPGSLPDVGWIIKELKICARPSQSLPGRVQKRLERVIDYLDSYRD
jgi:hypothetical protein